MSEPEFVFDVADRASPKLLELARALRAPELPWWRRALRRIGRVRLFHRIGRLEVRSDADYALLRERIERAVDRAEEIEKKLDRFLAGMTVCPDCGTVLAKASPKVAEREVEMKVGGERKAGVASFCRWCNSARETRARGAGIRRKRKR